MEMFRRFVLVGLLVLELGPITRGSIAQLVAGTAFSLLFLTIQVHAKPYLLLSDDYLALSCSLALVIILLTCLVFKISGLTEIRELRVRNASHCDIREGMPFSWTPPHDQQARMPFSCKTAPRPTGPHVGEATNRLCGTRGHPDVRPLNRSRRNDRSCGGHLRYADCRRARAHRKGVAESGGAAAPICKGQLVCDLRPPDTPDAPSRRIRGHQPTNSLVKALPSLPQSCLEHGARSDACGTLIWLGAAPRARWPYP